MQKRAGGTARYRLMRTGIYHYGPLSAVSSNAAHVSRVLGIDLISTQQPMDAVPATIMPATALGLSLGG